MSAKPKGWPWTVLDLSGAPASTAEVRRAYAKKLKTIDQAKDIAGFEALREAYETALARLEKKVRRAIKTTLPESAPEPVLDEPAAPPMQAAGYKPLASDPSEASPPADSSKAVPGDRRDPEDRPPEQPNVPEVQALTRLHAQLKGLEDRYLPATTTERVRQILDDPDFQSDDILPHMRSGLARFLLSQLISDHRGKTFLRYSTVPSDLLRMLDDRFGWLSDLSAYRRDFGGRVDLLDALVVTTDPEMEAEEQPGSDKNVALAMVRPFLYMILILVSGTALDKAEKLLAQAFPSIPGTAPLYIVLACFLAVLGFYKIFIRRRPPIQHWKGKLGIVWAGLGLVGVGFAADTQHQDKGQMNRLEFWVAISVAILIASLAKLLWKRAATYLRDRHRRQL